MLHRFKRLFTPLLGIWRRIKSPVGYSLFALAVGYGLLNAPDDLWQLQPFWLLVSLGVVAFMFFLQLWQVTILLHAHGARPGWLYPALFNARKGILNTVLPARTGTLLLLRSMIQRYAIGWQHFLSFFLLTGMTSFFISGLAVIWLLFPWGYSVALLLFSIMLSKILSRHVKFRYAAYIPALLLIAVGLYLATVALFYSLLHGLGYKLGVNEVSYFAVVLNVLAQVAITPGNIGVREVVMGLIAPHVTLPISVGIIASSLLLVLRLGVYGIFWVVLEWLWSRAEKSNSSSFGK